MRATLISLVLIAAIVTPACGQAGSAGDSSPAETSAGSSGPVAAQLAGITPAELASVDVRLAPPLGLTSTITEQQAAAAGAREFGGPVLEAKFFHCTRTLPGGFDGGCWAVSIKPPSTPQQMSAGATSVPPVLIAFELVLVTADDGAFIDGFSGSSQTGSGG